MTNSQDSSPEQVQNHTRVINSLSGPLEKRILLWLAARMPAWVTPDLLTGIGLAASVIIFFGYSLTYYNKAFLWLASFGFVLNWFGDSLDGTLARYRKIERPRYGFFVDHIIDSVSVVLIFIGFGLSPYLRFDLAMLALTSYLLLSIYVYLITYVNGIFRISYASFGPTEMRILAVLANCVVFFVSNPKFSLPPNSLFPADLTFTFYDVIAIGIVLLMSAIFIINAIQSAANLSVEDRAAHRAKVLQERAARAARRQALRDERKMRKEAARAARLLRTRGKLQIPFTGQDNQ